MTSEHVLFIPGAIMVGMFLGFILGARAARNQFDLQEKRAAEREAVKAARAARRSEKPAAEPDPKAGERDQT
jgi:hypothetical protein